MPDRFWSDGLHQMIEHKEGCSQSKRRTTIARITYQRFFRRYQRLAGMSGTLQPVARELWRVYQRPVVAIPTAKPVRRIHRPDVVVATDEAKWKLIIARVASLHERGLPVLIGTRSVAASERASAELRAAGLPHTVLNAAQDQHEAEIVARAGERGRITVATNMAGRGTDIHLGGDMNELGGLHVIMTERHDARRIDLQLAGRSGRQGQPGSFEAILSLEDSLMDIEIGYRAFEACASDGRLDRWLDRARRLAVRATPGGTDSRGHARGPAAIRSMADENARNLRQAGMSPGAKTIPRRQSLAARCRQPRSRESAYQAFVNDKQR